MQNFDFNEALQVIQSGTPITGSDGVLAPLIKQLTEAALNTEIDNRILSLYSHSMSYSDIRHHIAEIYQLEISEVTISGITDQTIRGGCKIFSLLAL